MAPQGTLKFFREWAAKAKPGDTVCYHTSESPRRPRGLFELMRAESDAGRVMLTQRREDHSNFPEGGPPFVTYWQATRISPRAAKVIRNWRKFA